MSEKALRRLHDLGSAGLIYYKPEEYFGKDWQAKLKEAKESEHWFKRLVVVETQEGERIVRWNDDNRHDPFLVQVVKELGEDANGACADLAITNIPLDVDYEISEYDGNEHVAEKCRKWYGE